MISIGGSLWFATTRVVCNRGDGERIERAIKKIGKPDYKGNDTESFSCCILIDIDFSMAILLLDSTKSFCYFRCVDRVESNS